MSAAFPGRVGKAKVSLVNEHRGLKRRVRYGAAEVDGGDASELAIDNLEFIGNSIRHFAIVARGYARGYGKGPKESGQ
jgi:hypothetical protein